MANEIELKLSLAATARRRFLRHPLLRTAIARRTQTLANLYYDTPDLSLQRNSIALRVRKQGDRWLQTVKCAGQTTAGLANRPEWEVAYPGQFDFSAIDDTAVRQRLQEVHARGCLAPLFETNFRRTTWRFAPKDGCALLLMLDHGWITSRGSKEEISEVEIELAGVANADSLDALFTLAQALGARVPLLPALHSKAERGYRLFLNVPLTPRKARAVPLLASDTPLEAFRRIALECLEQFQSNREGATSSDEAEFIHQMRVAARRLRGALRVFARCLPAAFIEELLPPLHNLMQILGAARDFDVLMAEVIAPAVGALPDDARFAPLIRTVNTRRSSARAAVVKHLQSIAHGQCSLLATALLHRPPFVDTVAAASAKQLALSDFAMRRLKRLHKQLLTAAKTADFNDAASLHHLRIRTKRLRYALEFFASLTADRPKRNVRLLRHLSRLQDELGQLNDLATAGLLLTRCTRNKPALRDAVASIGQWHVPRYQKILKGIPARLEHIRRLPLPNLT